MQLADSTASTVLNRRKSDTPTQHTEQLIRVMSEVLCETTYPVAGQSGFWIVANLIVPIANTAPEQIWNIYRMLEIRGLTTAIERKLPGTYAEADRRVAEAKKRVEEDTQRSLDLLREKCQPAKKAA